LSGRRKRIAHPIKNEILIGMFRIRRPHACDIGGRKAPARANAASRARSGSTLRARAQLNKMDVDASIWSAGLIGCDFGWA